MSHYDMGDGEPIEYTEDDCSVEFEQGLDPVLETAKAVDNAIRSARETVARLTVENAAQAVEIDRLRRENARHRRNGALRLAADLRKPETLLDVAARRLEGMSLPGYEKPKHWFEANTNGFSDGDQS